MRTLLLFVFLLASFQTASAQERLKIGSTYSGPVKVASPNSGTYLALPEGIWVLTSLHETRTNPGNSPMLEGRFVSIDQERRVLGAVSFSVSNITNSDFNWTVPSYCTRNNIFFLTAPQAHRRGKEILCWGVNHIGMTLGSNATKGATDFYHWVALNTAGMPKTMIAVEFYRASGPKYLRAAYYRNPEMEGFPPPPTSRWEESEWHKDRVVGDAKRLAYLENVKAWGEQWQPAFEAAFNGRPLTQNQATQSFAPISNTPASLERQLEELKSLFDKKLITEGDYDERRKFLLRGTR